MRIGIDARFWGHAGPGRYIKNLILNLEQLDHENEYVIFLNPGGLNDYEPQSPNFRKVAVNVPWYSFAEQIKLPFIFAREKLDLLHIPHYNIPLLYFGNLVVTIHDLTIHRFSTARATTLPLVKYRLKRLMYHFIFGQAVKRARKIFVPTEFVGGDLSANYPRLDSGKICVTYEGAGEKLPPPLTRNRSTSVLGKFGVGKPYLLYVGSMYPHKNLPRLVSAFKLVSEEHENLALVLVGKKDFFQARLSEEVARAGLADKVFFPAFDVGSGHIPDAELVVLYQEALCFVFPSLSEGFGLPPLEAMSFGIPVVASAATCVPEICGSAALYFDPEDTEDIARKIKAAVENPTLRGDLVGKGLANLKRFSWKKMAEETLGGYQSG